jgi:hypothetical protein
VSIIILHDLENRPIKLLISYIDKLVPIKKHASFPALKTQVILKPGCLFCSGSDNWIYVKETSEQIKNLITKYCKTT